MEYIIIMKTQMKTFYFNTGVRIYDHNPPVPLCKGQISSPNGVKIIPFDCDDVPDNATFRFACDNPNLKEASYAHIIVREIHNSTLISKYAYFNILT
jgi:hypothetical protein